MALRTGWTWAVAAIALAGCGKKPAEAPAELGELGLFLFQHFEDEDPAEMAAGLVNLREQVLATDLTQKPSDIAVTMPVLDGEHLGSLAIPDGVTADAQIPIALAGRSVHSLDKQVDLALEPNQVCIESESTVWAMRTFLAGDDCFAAGSCELKASQEVRKENFLAKVWYDQFKDYRWYDLGDDTRAIVGRSWIEQQYMADGGNNSWDQLFHLDVYIDDPGDPSSTLRWFSLWSSVTIGGVGDDLFASLVVDGISEALVYGDEFLSGAIETCPNDRDLPKPTRE